MKIKQWSGTNKPNIDLFRGDLQLQLAGKDGDVWQLSPDGLSVVASNSQYHRVSEGALPYVTDGSVGGSSLSEEAEVVNTVKGIDGKASDTVRLGAFRLQSGGSQLLLKNRALDTEQIIVGYRSDTDTSEEPTFYKFYPVAETPSAADRSEVFSGSTVQFMIPNANTGSALRYRLATNSSTPVRDVNIQIRAFGHTNEPPIIDYKVDAELTEGFTLQPLADPQNTAQYTEVELEVQAVFDAGLNIYVTITSEAGDDLQLLGQTLGGETIPWVEVVGRPATKLVLLTSERTGWALYQNTGSNISTPINVWTKLENNALGARTNEAYLPSSASTFWNAVSHEVDLSSVAPGNKINCQITFELNPGVVTDNFAARVWVTKRTSGGASVASFPVMVFNQALGIEEGGTYTIVGRAEIFAEDEYLQYGEATIEVRTDALFSTAKITELFIYTDAEPQRN